MTIFQNFLAQVLAVVVGGFLLGFLAWISGPLKWLWKNREMRKLVERRRHFILVYNPHENFSKDIVLADGGEILAGKNENEASWRIKRGCLEFLGEDGKVYSRFRLDRAQGQLVARADPDVRALFGQRLFPQY